MTDSEGGSQTADGSWHPDPTGRYMLRWQRSTGEWTHHVCGDDGTMGSDPHDVPTPPPSEPSMAEQLERFHNTPPPTEHRNASVGRSCY